MKYFSHSVLIYVKYNYDKSLGRQVVISRLISISISEEEDNSHDWI